MLTRTDLHEFLKSNGIPSNATLLVHTSMRALGEVDGGCDGLIDAFASYLCDGLFLVPTHTWANVDADSPIYNVRETLPCIGALPTVAAFRSDAVRSLHPTHSLSAFGKRAAEYVAGEENATSPCPPDGAWARLYGEGAKILLIGVGLNRNTYIHAIDEMIDLPDRLEPPIPLTVVNRNGERHEILFRKHGETGSENFGVFEPALKACGALSYATLGGATVGIFDVRRGTEIIKQLWSRAEFDLCKSGREIPTEYYSDMKI